MVSLRFLGTSKPRPSTEIAALVDLYFGLLAPWCGTVPAFTKAPQSACLIAWMNLRSRRRSLLLASECSPTGSIGACSSNYTGCDTLFRSKSAPGLEAGVFFLKEVAFDLIRWLVVPVGLDAKLRGCALTISDLQHHFTATAFRRHARAPAPSAHLSAVAGFGRVLTPEATLPKAGGYVGICQEPGRILPGRSGARWNLAGIYFQFGRNLFTGAGSLGSSSAVLPGYRCESINMVGT